VSDQGSDFRIRADQRDRLLNGDFRPLVFRAAEFPDSPGERLPAGCRVGARYVLARARGWGQKDGGQVRHLPPAPVWFITVTKVLGGPMNLRERRDGSWLVKFDVTDLRDRAVFLRPGGGDLYDRDPLDAGVKPSPEWLETRTKTVREFWHAERLKRHAEEMREKSRARARRRAA
jgi:hypothetical protein